MQQRESSQLLAKVLEQLRREGVSRTHIANELMIGRQELDKLVFGLVLTSLQGGRAGNSAPTRGIASLKLVEA